MTIRSKADQAAFVRLCTVGQAFIVAAKNEAEARKVWSALRARLAMAGTRVEKERVGEWRRRFVDGQPQAGLEYRTYGRVVSQYLGRFRRPQAATPTDAGVEEEQHALVA